LDEAARKRLAIIRVMPNTPALVLEGMSGMTPNPNAGEQEIAITRKILEAMGRVVEFKEQDMDAVTALSGSGPAYVFYLIESMVAAGIHVGLNPEDAEVLSLQTMKGALKLMLEGNESPEQLRRKVTSPGGTTEAAFHVFEKHRVKQHIVDAIAAATRRSKELSQ
jgi:pyrroline-5-carboxylate reductase